MTVNTNKTGQPVGPAVPHWQHCPPPEPILLNGRYCRLEPLNAIHHGADLCQVLLPPASPESFWTYLTVGPFEQAGSLLAFLQQASVSQDSQHFCVIDKQSGKALGCLALMRINPAHGTIEIGQVMFSVSMQRTVLASEAQFLLMEYVFHLGYRRCEWKCDSLNAPSCKAALRLGFCFEGIFRQAMIYKGRSRDTAWFSMLDHQWPQRKAAIQHWLAPANFDPQGQQRQSLSLLMAQNIDSQEATTDDITAACR